jgi:aspartyl-tRNA synthetase
VRHRATKSIRDYFDAQEFIEVETPALFKSTPEGAREYLVPSRIHPGQFYALSQSPQQFKQILMVAGVEKYFQIARCFRDEDLRADRQMEFTQVDVEASFVTREDIYALFEGMLKKVWKDVLDVDIPTPFLRMPFVEAMNRFGVDKPDLRFPLELVDCSDTFRSPPSRCSSDRRQRRRGDQGAEREGTRRRHPGELKALEDAAKSLGAKGLAFIKVEGRRVEIADREILQRRREGRADGAARHRGRRHHLLRAAPWEKACAILGRIRLDCAALLQKRGKLSIRPDDWRFLWVIDFPLMSYDEERAATRPRTTRSRLPVAEDAGLLDSNPKRGAGPALRRGAERHGAGRRLDPHSSAGAAEEGLRGRAEDSRRRGGEPFSATC